MNRDGHQESEILDRATQALRDTSVPPGPPAEALATLVALDGKSRPLGQAPPARRFSIRRLPMKRVISIAAAIVLFVALGAVIYHLVGGSATVAFAEVRRQIEQVETMKWTININVTMAGQTGPIKAVCYYKEPGLLRQEVVLAATGQKVISTVDFRSGKVLSLVPSEKTAVVVNMGDLPLAMRDRQKNVVGEMKRMVEGDAVELGTKQVNGRTVKGFRVTKNAQAMDIWVDPKTGEPVEMDMDVPGIGSMVMTDFQTGMQLDDSLFSLAVPEGYKQMNLQMPMGNISEDDLVAGLRRLAEMNSGRFPQTLMPTQDILKQVEDQEGQFKDLSEEEQAKKALDLVGPMVRMSLFTQSVKEFKYVGGGVELGDAGRIVCRYKATDGVKCGGAGPYRVVYGDLRIEDASAEEKPSAPGAEE